MNEMESDLERRLTESLRRLGERGPAGPGPRQIQSRLRRRMLRRVALSLGSVAAMAVAVALTWQREPAGLDGPGPVAERIEKAEPLHRITGGSMPTLRLTVPSQLERAQCEGAGGLPAMSMPPAMASRQQSVSMRMTTPTMSLTW